MMKRNTSSTKIHHPLKSPKSPYFNTLSPSSSSTYGNNTLYSDSERLTPTASTSSLTPVPSYGSDSNNGAGMIRRRGSSTNLVGAGGGGTGGTNSSNNNSDIDSDVTRPSLRRITSATKKEMMNGKGKARRSFDELSRTNGLEVDGQADREVVIHELVKTDSIASISLSYGITPQALRLSNRLWPSDSIHLRKTLNIPLDQCHLPSSSTIERISREEDGNLVVWERERLPPSSSIRTKGYVGGRRAASASAVDLAGKLGALGGSNYDLLGGLSGSGHRSSLDSFRDSQEVKKGRSTGPSLLLDGEDFLAEDMNNNDVVSGYLPSTNNPYSFTSAPPSPPPSSTSHLRDSPTSYNIYASLDRLNTTPLPPFARGSSQHSWDSISGLNGGESSNGDNSMPGSPNNGWNESDGNLASSSNLSLPSTSSQPLSQTNGGTLSRRTLLVSKVPSSSLSFFPPPNPSFHSASSNPSTSTRNSFSNEVSPYSNSTFEQDQYQNEDSKTIKVGTTGNGTGARKVRKNGTVPNTNNKTRKASNGGKNGFINSTTLGTALGLLNLTSSSSSSTDSQSTTKNGDKKHWTDRWNLSYFGEEEEQSSSTAEGGLLFEEPTRIAPMRISNGVGDTARKRKEGTGGGGRNELIWEAPL